MEEELIKLGFSSNEAKVYLELLKNPNQSAGVLSKSTKINRRTTYDTIRRLEDKGFIGHNITANRQSFFAMNPNVIIKNIKEMESTALELLPKLQNIPKTDNMNQVTVYNGRKGIRNILQLVLESKQYASFGSTEGFPNAMQHDFELFQNMKKKLKIKTKTILSHELKGKNILNIAMPSTSFKFLSGKITGPTSTFIFNGKVAIFIWEEPLFGILIENKKVFKSYMEYFEELWKIAKS
jgi:sugar-specific transcriptional regulator TrmB